MFGLTVGSGFALVSASVFASEVTLTVPANLNISVTPGANNGFSETSGTVSVYTDSLGGYSLDISAKNALNGNKLINGDNSIDSISEAISADAYKSTGPVNTWGFRPSSLNGKTNVNYIPTPTIDGINIAKTSVANLASQANDYTLGLAVKVDESVPAKTYSNDYVITAVAGPDGYANGTTCKVQDISGIAYAGLCWMWHDFREDVTWEEVRANDTCPNGWHLPTQKQFKALVGAIGSGNQLYESGWDGYYWSSTSKGSSAYSLDVTSSAATPEGSHDATPKRLVRCVAQ